MTELLDWSPPDGVEVLCAWLAPLAECRSKRPTGAVVPFIQVRRSGGTDDDLSDNGRYQISVFHETDVQAAEFATTVHRRLKRLVSRFAGQQSVTTANGTVYADNVRTIESFRPEPYGAEDEIDRVRAVYEIPFRYQ